jgi:hypothetical protein
MVNVFSTHVWTWNIETCQNHFKKRENNGENEPNQDTLYTYIEMLQWTLLYNYYTVIKMFKKMSVHDKVYGYSACMSSKSMMDIPRVREA